MNFTVEIPEYSGPMGILLQLIEDKKMDILSISISEITEGYLEIVSGMRSRLDPDEMSDFLLMAATLMQIKSAQLLYKPDEDEEDPAEELTRRLIEYKKYKEMVPALTALYEEAAKSYGKPMEDLSPYLTDELPIVPEVEILEKLFRILHIRQDEETSVDIAIPEDAFPIEHYMERICRQWEGMTVRAEDIFAGLPRVEKIITFLALLELIKDGWGKLTERNGTIFLKGGDACDG